MNIIVYLAGCPLPVALPHERHPPVDKETIISPIAELIHDLIATGYSGWLTVEQYGSRQMLSDSRTGYANVRQMLE